MDFTSEHPRILGGDLLVERSNYLYALLAAAIDVKGNFLNQGVVKSILRGKASVNDYCYASMTTLPRLFRWSRESLIVQNNLPPYFSWILESISGILEDTPFRIDSKYCVPSEYFENLSYRELESMIEKILALPFEDQNFKLALLHVHLAYYMAYGCNLYESEDWGNKHVDAYAWELKIDKLSINKSIHAIYPYNSKCCITSFYPQTECVLPQIASDTKGALCSATVSLKTQALGDDCARASCLYGLSVINHDEVRDNRWKMSDPDFATIMVLYKKWEIMADPMEPCNALDLIELELMKGGIFRILLTNFDDGDDIHAFVLFREGRTIQIAQSYHTNKGCKNIFGEVRAFNYELFRKMMSSWGNSEANHLNMWNEVFNVREKSLNFEEFYSMAFCEITNSDFVRDFHTIKEIAAARNYL